MIGSWKLADFAPGDGIGQGAAAAAPTEDWIDVQVPGDVHTALIAAGRIADPYLDRNELDCAWVEDREWWYRTTLTVDPVGPGERLRLVFEGLDTYATVYLNGAEVGRAANMFREHVLDVTATVTPGDNTLAVCFRPPLPEVAGRPVPSAGLAIGAEPSKVLMRKAQYGYGWDWGPRLPTIGIWRPVELRRERAASLAGVHVVTTSLEATAATLDLTVDVDRFAAPGRLTVEATLRGPDGEVVDEALAPVADTTATTRFHVADPRPWWTHDLGEPTLYTLDVSLTHDGAEVAHDTRRIGIRTIELDQSPDPDEPGTLFRFVLNGVPTFAKGGDWIPADSFVGAIPPERYERWVDATVEANMTMLRVWGGGVYEHDVFYDACDRRGVLVWQDFMFACAAYPDDDPAFVEEVRLEAAYQVRRLRNHPCLAAWVGNNECQMMGTFAALADPSVTGIPGDLLYDEVLPEVVRTEDGATPYWPGSPFGGRHPNDQSVGDVHDWTVWHGMSEDANLAELFTKGPTPEQVAYTRYAEDKGRFISEFGMHAAPVLETLRRVVPADQLFHHSASMDHHNKDNPKNKGDLLMATSTGLPTDLADYVDRSMIAQAEGLKFGIEHFRRRTPHCSGTLIWQLNDCWPCLSWSVMDYYGFPKAGYYYTRRVYAPVLASFTDLPDGSVELWVTNDRVTAYAETVVVTYGDFASGTVWEQSVTVEVPPTTSMPVWRSDDAERRADRYLSVRSPSAAFPANRTFFAAIKDLVRVTTAPRVEMSAVSEHEVRVRVTATSYLFFFHLLCSDELARYSDNYLDLAPGESVEITVTSPSVLTPGQLETAWR